MTDFAVAARGNDDLDLGSIGRALWRRKRWILLPAIVVAIASTVVVNLLTPQYKSEARVLYEGRENVFLRPEADKATNDQISTDQEAIANQVQIALSREVALDVIKQLKLSDRPEFDPVLGGISPVKYLMIFFGLARDPFQMTPEERILQAYYDRLTVYAVDKSRVVVVEFQSRDPELAAQIANAIADDYIMRRQAAKRDQTRGAGEWLAGEIEKLRRKVADAEARVEEFRAKTNLLVGTNNTTLANQQLGESNSQLAAARGQRADAETRARLIREMLRKGDAIDASDVVNSELIRRLSEQRVTLRAQLAEQSSTLLDGHPRIKELRAQLADLDHQIRAEAEKLVRTLESDAKIAGARDDALKSNMDRLKTQAASNSDQEVQLRALERESKAQRDLLESYLAKYREATARESIGSAPPADARVISHAVVSNTPYFPKKVPIVLVATLVMLALSSGMVVTSEVLRAASPGPAPGLAAPLPVRRGATTEHTHPALGVSVDAINDVASSLRRSEEAGRRIAVLSIVPAGAPKLAALTLARALAKDARVVLVDLAPGALNVSAISTAPNAPGIGDALRGDCAFHDIVTRDRLSRLHLVSAGRDAMDGAALLAAPRFGVAIEALARTYDYLIIDACAVPEALISELAALTPRAVLVTPDVLERGLEAGRDRLAAAGFAEVSVLVGKPIDAEAPPMAA